MNSETVTRLIQEYVLEDGSVDDGDPYVGEAFIFGMDRFTAFLFGQLSTKKLNAQYYVDVRQRLIDAGYKRFIYQSKHRRRILGGEPLNDNLPGFWLVTL